MRIAYFSPLPPCHTGVADYSQELLPHLAAWAEIDLFLDGYRPSSRRPRERFAIHDYRDFEKLSHHYQACLYHLGNDLAHEHILETMLRFPSFAVLHDVSLHPLVVALTMDRGDLVGLMRELGYAYGRRGVIEAKLANVRRHFNDQEFPIFHRVVDLNLGIIVHSQYAAQMIRAARPHANIAVIPQGTLKVKTTPQEEARRRLGLDPQGFLVATLGFVTPNKRLEPALGAFARFCGTRTDSRFLVVGEVPPWYDLAPVIGRLSLGERVLLTGRVPLPDFYAYAAAADVCLGLRYPTHGETSAALLRIMALGRPVVVSRIGSLAELPPGTCLHVPVGDGEEDGILEALTCLAGDGDLRRRLGQQARAYVAGHHSWPRAAQAYHQFIKHTLSGLWPEKAS